MAKPKRLKLYSAYVFKGDDKDPIIDKVHTVLDDEGVSYYGAAQKSGVSAATIHNWIEGDTKRPQYCTIAAVFRALGYEERWEKVNGVGHNSRRRRNPRLAHAPA